MWELNMAFPDGIFMLSDGLWILSIGYGCVRICLTKFREGRGQIPRRLWWRKNFWMIRLTQMLPRLTLFFFRRRRSSVQFLHRFHEKKPRQDFRILQSKATLQYLQKRQKAAKCSYSPVDVSVAPRIGSGNSSEPVVFPAATQESNSTPPPSHQALTSRATRSTPPSHQNITSPIAQSSLPYMSESPTQAACGQQPQTNHVNRGKTLCISLIARNQIT